MLIEISGMQKVGKSTLIEGIHLNFNRYKFPMGPVCKAFNVKPTWELQIAKDISTMELFQQIIRESVADKIPTISDRGPLSTIFYSILFNRTTDEQLDNFVKYLSQYKSFWRPIWVEAINQPEMKREKLDDFNNLQDGLDINNVKLAKQKMFGLLDKYGISYKIHINDFAMSIEQNKENFSEIVENIAGEEYEY